MTVTGSACRKEGAGDPLLRQARGLEHVLVHGIVARRTCRLHNDGSGTSVCVAGRGPRDEVTPMVVAQHLHLTEHHRVAESLGECFPGSGYDFLDINRA